MHSETGQSQNHAIACGLVQGRMGWALQSSQRVFCQYLSTEPLTLMYTWLWMKVEAFLAQKFPSFPVPWLFIFMVTVMLSQWFANENKDSKRYGRVVSTSISCLWRCPYCLTQSIGWAKASYNRIQETYSLIVDRIIPNLRDILSSWAIEPVQAKLLLLLGLPATEMTAQPISLRYTPL